MHKIFFYLILCVFLPFSTASAELNPLFQAVSKYDHVSVERVEAVDTFLLSNGERIVLIGLKGPNPPDFYYAKRDEYGFIIHDDDPRIPFSVESLRFVKNLVEKKAVRLEFDVERRNDDGVLQAYVFLTDGSMLNTEILRFGYAQLRLRMPNMKYAEQFRVAYKEARGEMRGIQGNW